MILNKTQPTRHTPQRQLILRTVKIRRDFPTADDVFRTVKKQFPAIGRATVYRNLELLTQRGEIASFEGPDRTQRYAGFVFHQATFRCQKCGRIEVLPVPNLEAAVDRAAGKRTVFFSRLDVRGLCRDHINGEQL